MSPLARSPLVFLRRSVIPDLEQVIIISGMAAVAASVIGAPITSVLIVLELTGSYEYGSGCNGSRYCFKSGYLSGVWAFLIDNS